MITKTGITLKPPLLFIDENSKPYPEVYSLINSLTEYFSQSNVIYDAELLVSNNEWVDIPGLPGCRKRHDISFQLNTLKEMHVKPDKIIFKLDDLDENEYTVNLSENFFYSIDYERAFYD